MIGNKILSLRKGNGLSQEMLADKLKVTRQTISNWELGVTVPDLKQAGELAKIFNVSLDDLIDNNIKDIQISEFNSSRNDSKKIFKILKIIGVSILIILFLILILVVSSMVFADYFSTGPTGQGVSTTCYYKDEYIYYEVWEDYQGGNVYLITENNEIKDKFKPYDYFNSNKMFNDIMDYIEFNGGECNIIVE